jgi:hypothetical protein
VDHAGRPLDPGIDAVRALLRVCEKVVRDRMGYDVQLELKSLAPKSGVSFEGYVQRKWHLQSPAAPVYEKALGQSQDREFAEHLIAAECGQFFLRRHDCGREQYSFWCLVPGAGCWAEGWPTLGKWCAELFGGCPYGSSSAGIKRIREYLTLACPQLIRAPKMDQVPSGLIPCAGGLYYDAALRATRPIDREHYVTKLWDLPPPTADSIAPEDLALVKETLEAVFPDGLYAAVVPRLAYDLLTVGNPHKGINFWIGDGDNGKTTTMKILMIAAPPGWIVSTRATNFTGRARGNEQTDWLTKLDGARLVYTEEPPKDESNSLDAEWLKELRGDSDVSCRSIYGSEREMNITSTLYCMANHVPHIEHLDEALKKSFIICDLPGKFVDDPAIFKKANPYAPWKQYVKTVDRELKAKLSRPGARSALMHILCEQYTELKAQGAVAFAPVPEEFAKWKDEMPRVEDQLREAFNCAYVIDAAASEPVRAKDILVAFRAANHELKINCHSLGAWMKRTFVDTKHKTVKKKHTEQGATWTGLRATAPAHHAFC